MTTALYRRYRPETFAEMIGQAQVTEPLMTALRNDKVGHAYLFSGPRGCGKTTSARILARCLNCAQGPTDVPCGACDSCVELSRAGGGSLDVVEIDAASHNGVDDARDLRERAIFAPARDRFKIFILDEAHMVTSQGFNALLKLVEEPPPHVKFIFATTEPEKVIGTIRSRTHHYPFRLVPPAAMLEYIEKLCGEEDVEVDAGVLPLVVRAGGGSPRDTLSILDQLIAGSEGSHVGYERAVALLGYTHAELLDEVVDAFAAADGAAAFGAVDRVVQTGQDPRRFVDDLLERLRDLIVIAAAGEQASAVLRGVPSDELERMAEQAERLGAERLSRMADLVGAALDDMTGATSPRLQLELMIARVLTRGAPQSDAAAPRQVQGAPTPAGVSAGSVAVARPVAVAPPVAVARPVAEPVEAPVEAPADSDIRRVAPPVAAPAAPVAEPAGPAAEVPPSAPAERQGHDEVPAAGWASAAPLTIERLRAEWGDVLSRLEQSSRSSWLVMQSAAPVALDGDVLTLAFTSHKDLDTFKTRTPKGGVSEDLRGAISAILGVRVKYLAHFDAGSAPSVPERAEGPPVPERVEGPPSGPADRGPSGGSTPPSAERRTAPPQAAVAPVAPPSAVTEWAVAAIPGTTLAVDDDPEEAEVPLEDRLAQPVRDGEVARPSEQVYDEPDFDDDPSDEYPPDDLGTFAPPTVTTRSAAPEGVQRFGEAVVRQVLGARFLHEEPYDPPTRFQ
ncbi:MAG: DNA polymerase III subunit gamma and tau [Microbacterium sp.]